MNQWLHSAFIGSICQRTGFSHRFNIHRRGGVGFDGVGCLVFAALVISQILESYSGKDRLRKVCPPPSSCIVHELDRLVDEHKRSPCRVIGTPPLD